MRHLSFDGFLLTGATGVGQVILAGVLALVGRALGPDLFGQVAVSLSIGMICGGLIDFGSNAYMLRELTRATMSGDEFGRRVGSKLQLAWLLGGIIVAASFGAQRVRPDSFLGEYWPVGVFLVSLVTVQALQVGVLASGRGQAVAWSTLSDRLVLGAMFTVLWQGIQLPVDVSFYVAYLAGAAVDGLICLAVVPGRLRPVLPVRPANFWRGSGHYGVSGLLVTLQSLDNVIAKAVAGSTVVGIYGAVARWTQPIGLATSGFAALASPMMAGASTIADGWRSIRGAMWLPATSMALALGVAVAADPLVGLVLGPEFAEAGNVLRVLCAAAAIGVLNQILSVFLQARRRERSVARATGIGVALQLVCVALLASSAGAFGVAWAGVAGQGVMLVGFLLVAGTAPWRVLRQVGLTR